MFRIVGSEADQRCCDAKSELGFTCMCCTTKIERSLELGAGQTLVVHPAKDSFTQYLAPYLERDKMFAANNTSRDC